MLLLSIIISGCTTDNAVGINATVFKKISHYNVVLKSTSSQDAVNRLMTELKPTLNNSQSMTFIIQYRTNKAKTIAYKIKRLLSQYNIAPSDIHLESIATLANDIEIIQQQYNINIPTCPSQTIGRPTIISGCYVDSLRLQQINHPENLYKQYK